MKFHTPHVYSPSSFVGTPPKFSCSIPTSYLPKNLSPWVNSKFVDAVRYSLTTIKSAMRPPVEVMDFMPTESGIWLERQLQLLEARNRPRDYLLVEHDCTLTVAPLYIEEGTKAHAWFSANKPSAQYLLHLERVEIHP